MNFIDELNADASLTIGGTTYTLEKEAIEAACKMTIDWKESYKFPPGDLCLFIHAMVSYKHVGYITDQQIMKLAALILKMNISDLEGRLAAARTNPILNALSISYRPNRIPLIVELPAALEQERRDAEAMSGSKISPEDYWNYYQSSRKKKKSNLR